MRFKSLLTVALAVTLLSTVFVGGALAQDDGDAVAIQTNDQSNENSQVGVAVAENSAEDVEQENEIDIDDGGIEVPSDGPGPIEGGN